MTKVAHDLDNFQLSSSSSVLFVKDFETLVFGEHLIRLRKHLKRILVVLGGALGKDVHPEVCLVDFLFVGFLVGGRKLISLSLKFLLIQTTKQKGKHF